MGLLDRLRPARGGPESAEGAGPAEAAEAAAVQNLAPDPVIRPATLHPGPPEWSKVPSMPPSFPDMPVVVSTHFDQDLVARRPPELFIGELGHAVSESAPAGMVEAVAVLVPVPVPVGPPGPATQAAAEESALTLATPPRPERAPRARPETVRRVPGFDRGDPAATETVDEDELEADGGSQDAPQPPAE